MTALVSYSTGTVSVADGGTTVTGTGTIWSGVNVRAGDVLQIGNFQSVISDVVDTGTLTIPPWGGGDQTDVAYKVWQVSAQRFAGAQAMADVSTLVAALNTSGFYVFVGTTETEPDPSLGNDGQYAFQPTTGKTWAKSAGAWSYLGMYKAFQIKGAWDSVTAYAVGDVVTLSGSSYVCVLDHTNHTPPNVTYWQLLASKGTDGADGAAATVSVGTVTTGAGGSSAAVTNSGTSGAAVLDFTIPAGKTYGGTSSTSLTIGTGSKAFTTQSGLAYQNGARVRASSAANTSNWMEGLVTYSGTTLTINVDKTNGSGTLADWNLNVVGEPGAGDLSSANNLSELANKATSRNNLSAFGVVKKQVFTSSGTYTPSANLLYAIIECVGGGGGGGGAIRTLASATTIGASQTVTIGAAGSGGAAGANNGTAGGNTSVGTLCVANGGNLGQFASVGQFGLGGAGGAIGTGDITAGGGGAGTGIYSTVSPASAAFLPSGAGGSSVFGGGGKAILNGSGGGGSTNGNAGIGYGAGGSGGSSQQQSSGTTSAAGGNGTAGIVVITEFCSS